MKNVSLLIIGNFLSKSLGTRSVCEDLADHLKDSGWPVITTSSKKEPVSRLLDMLSTIWKKKNDYEVAQLDVYSGRAFYWAEACCWALRRLDKPYILTLHGGNLPEFSRKHPKRVQKLLNSASAVTSPSAYLADFMIKFRNDLMLIPNPIQLNSFQYQLRKIARPKLIWLRAFHQIYNPQLAARVLSVLEKEFPDIQLMMGGPDKDATALKELKKTAELLQVSKKIQISGSIPREKVGAFLNQGDIFLNTTYFDNTPVSLMEAMACGLCIVTTNVGGIPKLVEHEHQALLVPPNDEKAMAKAVGRILTDPELASKISRGARAGVEKFDWSHILPKWHALFVNVNNRKRNQSGLEIRNASIIK